MRLFVLTMTFITLVFSPALFSKVKVGEEVLEKFETPHPYKGIKGVVWEKQFHWPKAGYIAIHFSKFHLANDDYVSISSPDEKFSYRYKGKGKEVKRGVETVFISEFWAAHIPGDSAIVRLYSQNSEEGWGFVIDKWSRGYEQEYIKALMEESDIPTDEEAICTLDDKEWAKCYAGTTMYEKSRAVCRLLINGTRTCTGWLLGSEGHVITNQHCIENQGDADNTDFEFMAEGATCSTDCSMGLSCPGTIVATASTLIKSDYDLDYALVLLPTNVTSTYGYLRFRKWLPTVGERIYVPQHPSAKGKQLAVNSDTDGPYTKIYSIDEWPCRGGGGDIGYYADTEGASSGSPVIAYTDHQVVALHHCANCPNRGVRIPEIITHLDSDLPENAIRKFLELTPDLFIYLGLYYIDPLPPDPLLIDDDYKNRITLGADWELPLNRNLSLLLIGGYGSYESESGAALKVFNASLNGKFYLTKGNVRLFVNGGTGYYLFNPGENNFGFNLGGGIKFQLAKWLVMEVGYNFHNAFKPGKDNRYSFLQTGIKIF